MEFSDPLLDRLATRETALQLRDAASSVAANYVTALRAKSHRDFTSQLGTVLTEAAESFHWLKFIRNCRWTAPAACEPLIQEADELVAIFTASVKTAKAKDAAAKRRRRLGR